MLSPSVSLRAAGAPPAPADRTWTLWSVEGAVDVAVRAPDDGSLGDVLESVAGALGLPTIQLWAGSAPLAEHTPLHAPALRHGAVLGLGRPGPRDTSDAASGALELQLVGGPDAGRSLPLGQGPLVVGRGTGCGLMVTDPDVSRRHAVISVAQGRVSVADLGSSNGTSLSTGAGAPAPVGPEPVEWPVGATLRIGGTGLRLTGPAGAALAQLQAPGGRLLLRPSSAASRPPRAVTVRLPAPPPPAARRRLGWVTVALPAVGGGLMAWFLSTPQFLFFALLSPLVAVAGWASDRVTGRRDHGRAFADHAVQRALAQAGLDAAVAAAVAERDEAHPDVARLAAAARRRCGPLWSRTSTDPGGLTVRLGTGPGPTTVTRVDPDGTTSAATADHLPVTVPLAGLGGLGIVGPREPVLGVARSVVCQLAVLASPAHVELVVACTPSRAAEWSWLRWLPHVRGVVLPGAGLPGELAAAGPTTVVVLDGPVDAAMAEALAQAPERVVLLDIADPAAGLTVPASARIEVAGETGATGRLWVPGAEEDRGLTLDTVSRATAASIARHLAPLTAPAAAAGLPDAARLLDLPAAAGLRLDRGPGAVGDWDRRRTRLRAVLGAGVREPHLVDLVADGPHALIAGTTGSGKSELLQTLVASLALHHPPDRCSFLLVDYKGGAAFGEAATLPHTVGVVTDLDHQSTARALRSLSTELTRRERLLATHRVRDLAELPDTVAASRLVIIVDEFASLAEELPTFVHGLVGIAQRGRSLGVHLVLATQRPAGVVSPEIRANCSLRICLRTTDQGDARDVLGSTAPASLPPDRPGRAYVRTGSAAPVLVQVARVSGTRDAAPLVDVRRSPWPPEPAVGGVPTDGVGTVSDLRRVVTALAARAGADGLQPPERPWLPPLPERLDAADLDVGDAVRTPVDPPRLRIGLQDLPDAQAQVPFELDLAGGGWLVVGGPRSGRTTALRTVLGEAVRRLPPDRLHVHVLDHGGGALAREASRLPHCGTTVDRSDAHRSVRLLARLGEEVDRRRSEGTTGNSPLLLVLVDGYDSLVGQLEGAEPATGASGLLRLVRDGAAVGVTVVLTAERAVPGSRVAGAVRCRLVLPLPDLADYAIAGVPARSVPGHRPPGRALVGEDAVECQLALPREPADPPAMVGDRAGPPPIRVVALPADPELPLVADRQGTSAEGLWLPVGPGGDDGATVGVDLMQVGGLLVVGPPGSGRSAALLAFARHCTAAGRAVVQLVDAPAARSGAGGEPNRLGRGDVEALRSWLAGSAGQPPPMVIADDLTSLPDAMADLLGSLPARSAVLLAAGTAAELAGSFRGPAVALRRSRTALLLRPTAGDGELLGLRTPRTPVPPRPGAGWLVSGADAVRVQVALRRTS